MLYRLEGGHVVPVPETTTLNEKLLEADVERWIEASPDVLGEELLVIGRQVDVDRGANFIDLLALDLAGNLVIIELKRDLVGGDADLQAVRYASMAARWDHAQIRQIAEGYWKAEGHGRGSFTAVLDEFCDDDYEVNGTQRIVLAGRHVAPRLGTMALWLRERGVDVRVVGIELYRDGDRLYLQPQVLIPIASEADVTLSPDATQADKEWKRDGASWHLDQRLSADGREIAERFVDIVSAAVPEADGPSWAQKAYFSFKQGSRIWLRCYTDSPHQIAVLTRWADADTQALAETLGLQEFTLDADLATKLEWLSSVGRDSRGNVRFIFKSRSELDACAYKLAEVLQQSWIASGGALPTDDGIAGGDGGS